MSDRLLPRILLTPGEPAGIGPDVVIQLAQRSHDCELIVVGDPALLEARAEQMDAQIGIECCDLDDEPKAHQAGMLRVWPMTLAQPVQAGVLNPQNSAYVLQSLRSAIMACVYGRADALVTGPVHKGVINDAGFPFTGHTEFLAELTGSPLPVMMLVNKHLRVALVTTHLPLRAVADRITAPLLAQTLEVLQQGLQRDFALPHPRIAVCGLNPHAGEGGHLGREEIEVIEPTLAVLREQGFDLSGPWPADTLFATDTLKQCDAVLAMYHDQGLPVLKYAGFGEAANITLGLPIIRTSVDHGTALDLAGTGTAQVGSLMTALKWACVMVENRRKTPLA
jgi:4-hydroxythreonine-4-phosphate dehydrogenase